MLDLKDFTYTEEQFINDIKDLSTSYGETTYISTSRKFGALVAAAIKRRKRQIALEFLLELEEEMELDITPTLAKHLLKEALGRIVSWKQLLLVFGDETRTGADKSQSFLLLEAMKEEYAPALREAVDKEHERCLSLLKQLRKKS